MGVQDGVNVVKCHLREHVEDLAGQHKDRVDLSLGFNFKINESVIAIGHISISSLWISNSG